MNELTQTVFSAKSLLSALNTDLKSRGLKPISRATLYRWLSDPRGRTTDIGIKSIYTIEDLMALTVFAKAMLITGRYECAQRTLIQWRKNHVDD